MYSPTHYYVRVSRAAILHRPEPCFTGKRLDFTGMHLDFTGMRLDFTGMRLDFIDLCLTFMGRTSGGVGCSRRFG